MNLEKEIKTMNTRMNSALASLASGDIRQSIYNYLDSCSIAEEIPGNAEESFYLSEEFDQHFQKYSGNLTQISINQDGTLNMDLTKNILEIFQENYTAYDPNGTPRLEAELFLTKLFKKINKNEAEEFCNTYSKLVKNVWLGCYRNLEEFSQDHGLFEYAKLYPN